MAVEKRRSSARREGRASAEPKGPTLRLRIIGGRFRGRRLCYSGDPRVRPMKDRLREAVFNLLGPAVKGRHAVDLFAGTGALALEALSRGAARATLVEQHFPTAEIIRQNVATLGVGNLAEIVTASAFSWFRRGPQLGSLPWVVFSSPPYDFYVQRADEMLELIGGLLQLAPAESILVVESDARFDFALLPDAEAWDVRRYPPAIVGIYHKPSVERPTTATRRRASPPAKRLRDGR